MLQKDKMVSRLESAQKAAQRAIENVYYTGICTITERRNVKDETTGITRKSEVTVVENQPCRLSFETLNPSPLSGSAANTAQSTKLFISPEITVNSGSRITVEQSGKKTVYRASGEPAVYPSHQEIMLELFKAVSYTHLTLPTILLV